jgi:hypothetical protein
MQHDTLPGRHRRALSFLPENGGRFLLLRFPPLARVAPKAPLGRYHPKLIRDPVWPSRLPVAYTSTASVATHFFPNFAREGTELLARPARRACPRQAGGPSWKWANSRKRIFPPIPRSGSPCETRPEGSVIWNSSSPAQLPGVRRRHSLVCASHSRALFPEFRRGEVRR